MQRKIIINADVLMSFLHSGPYSYFVKNGIPKDSKVVGCSVFSETEFEVTLSSEEFSEKDPAYIESPVFFQIQR